MKYFFLLFGILAGSLSGFYLYNWLEYTGQPWLVALLLTILYMSFSVTLFEIGLGEVFHALEKYRRDARLKKIMNEKQIAQYKEGKKEEHSNIVLGVIGIVISVAMTGYTMGATIAEQYNVFYKARTGQKIVIHEDHTKIAATLKSQVDELKHTIEQKQGLIDGMAKEASQQQNVLTSPDATDKQIAYARWRVPYLNNLIDKANKELAALKPERDAKEAEYNKESTYADSSIVQEQQKIASKDVFSYLAIFLGLDALFIQFLSSAVPTLFLDFITLTAFAFFFYYRPKK